MQQQESWIQAFPALRVLLPLLMGIGISALDTGGAISSAFYLLFAATVCLALGLLSFQRQASRFIVLWNVLFFLFWGSVGAWVSSRSLLSFGNQLPQEKIVGQVILLSSPQETAKTFRSEAIVMQYAHRDSIYYCSEHIRLSLQKDSLSKQLQVGDALTFHAAVRTIHSNGNPYEFDYASYMKRAGVTGEAMLFSADWKLITASSETHRALTSRLSTWLQIKLFFMNIRQNIVSRMKSDGLQGEAFSVYAALTMGDKSHLPKDIKELYAQTGTSHILALSGMHLGILLFFFYYFFGHGLKYSRWRWPFCILAVFLVWFYTLLAGLPISLVRASMMYTFSLCGMLLHRRHFTLNILFWTAAIMLFIQPQSLYDVGFQLSFSAMFGILLLQKRIERIFSFRRKLWQQLWSGISVSLAAQITTTPLVLYYFHYFATTSILATLCLSLTTMLLLYALPLYLLLMPVATLAGWIMTCVTLLIHMQHTLLHWFSSWSFARLGPVYISWSELIVLYIIILSAVLFLIMRKKLIPGMIFVSSFVTLLVLQSLSAYRIEQTFPMLVFYNNYKAPSVHLIFNKSQSYLLQTQDTVLWDHYYYLEDSFWKRYATRRPVPLGRQAYSDDYVCSGHGLLCSSDITIGMLHRGLSSQVNWDGVKHIDYLYLCRGFKGDISHIMQHITPGLVILDRSLTDYEHKQYVQLCNQKQWKYHDMRQKGALKVAFKSEYVDKNAIFARIF